MQQTNTIIDIYINHGKVLKGVFFLAAILEKSLGKVWNLKRP
jgi:hypothetical protein